MNRKNMEKMYRLQLQMYRNQLDLMKEEHEACRTLRHDMKHHIVMLTDYIGRGESRKALEYLQKIDRHVKKSGDYIETGNAGIDSALNYMIGRLKEMGGRVSTDIRIEPGLSVDDFDISVILGNLLLNAGEAMEKCPIKELGISINYGRGLLRICIKNTYDGILMQEKGKIVTRKKDAANHGRGLASVRRTIKKYDGDMKIRFDEKEFQVDAVLYVTPLSC